MGTHLYVCENGGPMVVATEGTPPRWVTCPIDSTVECARCGGAQLQGEAQAFTGGSSALYRCKWGHGQTLRISGVGLPESAQCPVCDGLMLPEPSSAEPACSHA